MFRFTIRDVLWLTVVAAVMAAWWVERSVATDRVWKVRAHAAADVLASEGWRVCWKDDSVDISKLNDVRTYKTPRGQ